MGEQLSLGLPTRVALGREDFAVSPANAAAVALVEGWRGWPEGKLALCGPPGAGKTHLAHVWAELSGAVILQAGDLDRLSEPPDRAAVVEDVPAIGGNPRAEEALFHLHNRLHEIGAPLLVTGTEPPARWPLALPDLASRMQAATLAMLQPPDDALLSHVLLKLFADRQILPPPGLIAWLVPRMERSFAEAGRIVAEIDRRALAGPHKVTRDLARAVLHDQRSLDL